MLGANNKIYIEKPVLGKTESLIEAVDPQYVRIVDLQAAYEKEVEISSMSWGGHFGGGNVAEKRRESIHSRSKKFGDQMGWAQRGRGLSVCVCV